MKSTDLHCTHGVAWTSKRPCSRCQAEEDASVGAHIETTMAEVDKARANIAAIESKIEQVTKAHPMALYELDAPEDMERLRSQGRAFSDGAEILDGLFSALAAEQEFVNRRMHDLGYM